MKVHVTRRYTTLYHPRDHLPDAARSARVTHLQIFPRENPRNFGRSCLRRRFMELAYENLRLLQRPGLTGESDKDATRHDHRRHLPHVFVTSSRSLSRSCCLRISLCSSTSAFRHCRVFSYAAFSRAFKRQSDSAITWDARRAGNSFAS